MNDLTFVPAHELATMIRQRRVSSVEVLEAHLAQVTQHNPAIHAIVTLDEDGARQRAKAADVALGQGQVCGPLHGVPITLEDAHPSAGLRSTQSTIETLAHELERMGAHVEQCLPEVNFAEQLGLAEHIFGMLAGTFQPRPEGTPPVSLEDYLLALDQRDAFIVTWEKFFGRWDVFIGPAGPRTAERRSDTHVTLDGAELSEDQEKLLEIPYALSPVSGCPMVVVPAGLDQDGLPFGAQLMGHRWEDERLLAIAELISEVTGGFRRPPGY